MYLWTDFREVVATKVERSIGIQISTKNVIVATITEKGKDDSSYVNFECGINNNILIIVELNRML